jgi:hypothetical protein
MGVENEHHQLLLRNRYLLTRPGTPLPPITVDYEQITVPQIGAHVELGPEYPIRQWTVVDVYWILHNDIPSNVVIFCEPDPPEEDLT